jgi:pimeloyl-ACP methyl ester carboxylesterase
MTAATATKARASNPNRGGHPPSKFLALTEPSRALGELAAFYALRPLLSFLPRGDGHGVLVLPGFMAADGSTRPMRNLLSQLGYEVTGWNLGRNVRVDNERVTAMGRCVTDLYEKTGAKISIIGWSLGGVFARELAKQMPDMVRQVITLGSPISDDFDYTNARRLFEMINGPRPEPMRTGKFKKLGDAPPVPTTSILTKGDGVVHWHGSVQHPGDNPQTENIEVFASHIGLGVNPAVMLAIADRLAQAEAEWKPFHATGCAAFAFPRTTLN